MNTMMFVVKIGGVMVGRSYRQLVSRLSRYVACASFVLLASNAYAVDQQLHFPQDAACGLVMTCDPPVQINGFNRRGEHPRVIAHALGDITIPANNWLRLQLHAESESQRSAVRSLPKSGIHGLCIDRGTVDHATLASVCGIASLEVLDLRGCRLTDDAFSDQRSLPKLKEFRLYAERSNSDNTQVVQWMRNCRQLEYFIYPSELSSSEWKQLADHPNLNFVTVSMRQDADEVIRTLKSLKNLRGLNIIAPGANPGFVELLAGLDRVEWINWSGGRFGEREAKSLTKLKSLKTLVLQGNVELPVDFLIGLPQFDRLQRLSINTSKIAYDPAKVIPVLNEMPALTNWPTLENLDSQGFAQLRRRNDIASLELLHIDDEVDREELKSFLARLHLEQLSLHDGKLEGLDYLAGQNELEQLRLRVPVRGEQLSTLSSLPKLKELRLNVDGAENLSYSPLAKCLALEAVYIEGEMSAADDIGSLSQSKSIRSLSIESGYVDDATADWLCQAESITDVSLGRDAMLTDIGVKKLSTKQNLESLDVGGLISLKGAEALSSLGRLRRLNLHSPLLTEADQESLKSRLSHVPSISFSPADPLRGPWEKGKDGFLRIANKRARKLCAGLEGQPAPELSGKIASNADNFVDLKELRGKVVIVDFWGVWCGPCLRMMPYLAHLEKKYADQGLCVIGVHSQTRAEGINAYLSSHPKAWPNIVDSNGTFAKGYEVSVWPSLYIIDKQGRVRVALPHVLGLDAAVAQLLSE